MIAVVDRIVQYANRYKLTDVSTGTVLGIFDFEAETGTIQQVGTEINKELFDSIASDIAAKLTANGGDSKDCIISFGEAQTLANINSGESHSTIFGKIKKWFTDRISGLKAFAYNANTKIAKTDLDSSVQTSLGKADTALQEHQDISGKVDKVAGKGLSTEDYTTTEKSKLAGIASGAEVNVQSDWSQSDNTKDDYIKNKPTKLTDFNNDGNFVRDANYVHTDSNYTAGEKTKLANLPTDAVRYGSQTLTDAQKAQARSNIGAGTSNASALSDLTQNANYRTVTDAEKSTWNAKAGMGDLPSNDRLFFFASGVGVAAGNGTSGSYLSTKWKATIIGITTPTNGLKLAFRIPANYPGVGTAGAVLSINNGASGSYYPVVFNVNSVISTRYSVGSTILLTFNSTQTATAYLTSNTSSTVTGCWQIMDYDANNYAYVRQYQHGSNAAGSTNKYPILTRYNLTNKNGTYDTAYSRYHTGVTIDTSNGNLDAPTISENGTALSSKYQAKLSSYVSSVNGQTGAITNVAKMALSTQTGSFYASSFYASSDRRLKENIKPAELNCGKVIDDLQIKEFNFKSDEEKKVVVGAIAQELQEILPEKYRATLVSGSEDTHYSINEGKLLFIAIGALKEERAKTKELEERLAKLEKMLGV